MCVGRSRWPTAIAVAVMVTVLAGCGSPRAGGPATVSLSAPDPSGVVLTSWAVCEGMARPRATRVALHPFFNGTSGHLSVHRGRRVLVVTRYFQRRFTIPTVVGGRGAGRVLRRLCAARSGYADEAVFAAAAPGSVALVTSTNDCGPCASFGARVFIRVS